MKREMGMWIQVERVAEHEATGSGPNFAQDVDLTSVQVMDSERGARPCREGATAADNGSRDLCGKVRGVR